MELVIKVSSFIRKIDSNDFNVQMYVYSFAINAEYCCWRVHGARNGDFRHQVRQLTADALDGLPE